MKGAKKVGKTSIINRFTKDELAENQNTLLENHETSKLSLDGRLFELHLHDTTTHHSIPKEIDLNSDGFIFVFSFDIPGSFSSAIEEIEQIRENIDHRLTPIVLIGNKSDLEDKTTEESLPEDLYINNYYTLSAKYCHKEEIDQIFYDLIEASEMLRFSSKNVDETEEENENFAKTIERISDLQWNPCENSLCEIM